MLFENLDRATWVEACGPVKTHRPYLAQIAHGLEYTYPEVAWAQPVTLRVVQHGQERFFDAHFTNIAEIT